MNRFRNIVLFLTLSSLFGSLCLADTSTTGGARVLENPTSDGDLIFRINDGGTKKSIITITGSTGDTKIGHSTQGTPFTVFRDTNAGDSTNTLSLDVGNSGSTQGQLRIQYTNAAAAASPSASISFQPRNNANTTNTNAASIDFTKDAGADTGKINLSANKVLVNGYAQASAMIALSADCTTSPCTIDSNYGGMLSTVTRSATGTYSLNFTASFWSSGPSCTVSGTAGGNQVCLLNTSGLSTTSYGVKCKTANTGADVDSRFSVTCHGPR